MKQIYIYVSLALLLTLGAAVYSYTSPGRFSRDDIYAPRDVATKLLKVEGTEKPTAEKGTDPVSEKLSKVFEFRFEQYKGNLESLNTYLWFQLIFMVAAGVAISTKSDSLNVPVIDKDVPVRWALAAIPVCLLYFWLRYGFTLNELIDARTVLWKVNEAMTSTAITNRVELSKALYTFSHVPATYDGGYLDGWFITFEPLQYTLTGLKGGRQLLPGVLMALFGVFLGISNGSTLGLILAAKKRFTNPDHNAFYWDLYFWLIGGLLIFTHWSFWLQGKHLNWQQPIAVGVGCFVAARLAKLPKPEEVKTPTEPAAPPKPENAGATRGRPGDPAALLPPDDKEKAPKVDK